MFSSEKNLLLFKEVLKRLCCLRNTRTQWEHLHFVSEMEIWSSCSLLGVFFVPLQGMTCTAGAAEVPALCPSSPHRQLKMALLLVGLLLMPCSLQPCVLLQEQLGHPCSETRWFVEAAATLAVLAFE